MIDCRICCSHRVNGDCMHDSYQERPGGEFLGITRCPIHDKTATHCPYYWPSDDLREYYEEHPLEDLPIAQNVKSIDDKDYMAYLLHKELLETAEKFAEACPKADADVILGAGNLYIAGFLINAPTKQEALKTLESCVEIMRRAIDVTPDNLFGGGIARHFTTNQN